MSHPWSRILAGLATEEVILAGNQLFSAQEGGKGLHQAIHDAISQCDEALHPTLWSNIVLHGGGSQLPGLRQRLQQEIQQMKDLPPYQSVTLKHSEQAHLSACRGAAALSQVATNSMYLTSDMYSEFGPSICRSFFLG